MASPNNPREIVAPNPYLLEFYALHENYDSSRAEQRDRFMYKKYEMRTYYAYAVPTARALDTITFFGPIVEPMAGTGYWASLLRKTGVGVDVMATDLLVPDGTGKNEAFPGRYPHTIVEELSALDSVKKYPDRTLMLCFPEASIDAFECADAYTGKHLVYVGDADWRYTGGMLLQQHLYKNFSVVKTVELPSWPGESTKLTVWSRR